MKLQITIPPELELLAQEMGVDPRLVVESFMADLVSNPENNGYESRQKARLWLLSTNLPFGNKGEVIKLLNLLDSGFRMRLHPKERMAQLREYFPEEKKEEVRHG